MLGALLGGAISWWGMRNTPREHNVELGLSRPLRSVRNALLVLVGGVLAFDHDRRVGDIIVGAGLSVLDSGINIVVIGARMTAFGMLIAVAMALARKTLAGSPA